MYKQNTKISGAKAEQAAMRYLEEQGLKLLEANFSCKYGEIDLIMQDKDTYVFVEVRYRKKDDYTQRISSCGAACAQSSSGVYGLVHEQRDKRTTKPQLERRRVYVSSIETITQAKQNKIIRTANYYLIQHKLYDKVPCRFDVVATESLAENAEIFWLKDAFWVQ